MFVERMDSGLFGFVKLAEVAPEGAGREPTWSQTDEKPVMLEGPAFVRVVGGFDRVVEAAPRS